MEATTALVWDCATLQNLMEICPRIRQNLSQVLMGRLNELEERFREVATEKVPRRLALALMRLSKHVGKQVHEGVEVSLSREELAQMTGTTLFTISRILSQWAGKDSSRRAGSRSCCAIRGCWNSRAAKHNGNPPRTSQNPASSASISLCHEFLELLQASPARCRWRFRKELPPGPRAQRNAQSALPIVPSPTSLKSALP